MISKILNIIKKYKLSLIIASIIIIVGIAIILCFNTFFNEKIKIYSNDYYSIQYDNSWSLKKTEKNEISLKKSNKAKIAINIIELTDENKYSSIDDLIEEVLYKITIQNENYKLLSKSETILSKEEYNGYKLLYENGNSQAMIAVYKKSDKLIIINYESQNDYFDILLDSAENIIYNFVTKEKKYDLNHEIAIEENQITFLSDDDLDSILNDSKEYEIAYANYYVKYSIPSNFELYSLSMQSNYFNFYDNNYNSISIYTNINKKNIYEYLKEDQFISYKKMDDSINYTESIMKLDSAGEQYLLKCSFDHKTIIDDKYSHKEVALLVFSLNKNHIFVVEINTTGLAITEKLINSIKLLETKNYSSYTTSEEKDGLLVGTLKRYTDYTKEKIEEISLKLPTNYVEIQKYNDIYEERIYGLNYDEENDIYDYTIKYKLTSTYTKVETQVDSINSSFSKAYGEYNYLTKIDNINVNNNIFEVYNGGYTNLGGIMFTNIDRFYYYINKKVLFLTLKNGGYLVIEISGNGKEITQDIINHATNFDINEIDN